MCRGQRRQFSDRLRFVIMMRLAGGEVMPSSYSRMPINSISQLYDNADHADVELRCGSDLVIKAHRAILAAHSDTLRAAFSSRNYVEGVTGVYTIAAEHMSPAIFQAVIQWMYLREINIADDIVIDLLVAADYFQIAGLKAVCADVLIRELRVDNCLELLDMAYKYNIGDLKRPASDLLIINRDHRGATFGHE